MGGNMIPQILTVTNPPRKADRNPAPKHKQELRRETAAAKNALLRETENRGGVGTNGAGY